MIIKLMKLITIKVMKKVLLFIFLLSFLTLTGCSYSSNNSIGIKEKQTKEFVSLPYEEFIYERSPHLSSTPRHDIPFPIQLNYPNENISYSIKSNFGVVVVNEYKNSYDLISYVDENYKIEFKYNNKSEEIIYFAVPVNSQIYYEYYGNLYVDIVIKENNKTIGYCLIKLDYDFESTVNGKIIKQAYFPDFIKKDFTILDESTVFLLNENKEPISIENIQKIETDRFFEKLDYVDQYLRFLKYKENNVDRTYIIYNEDSLSIDYNIVEIEFSHSNKKSGISFIFEDRKSIENINEIYNIIIKENNRIVGYAIIKMFYVEAKKENNYRAGVYHDILCQYEFPSIISYNNCELKQYITEELVREIIKNKNIK